MADTGRTVFASAGGGGLALNGGFSPLPHLYAWPEGGPASTSGTGVVNLADLQPIDTSDDTTDGEIEYANGTFTVNTTGIYVINFLAQKSDKTTTAVQVLGGGTGWYGPSFQKEFTHNDISSCFITVPLGSGAAVIPAVAKVSGGSDVSVVWMEVQMSRIL